MSRFKAGDLALVIGSAINCGRCVELIYRVVGPARVEVNDGRQWVEVPDGIPAWVVKADRLCGTITKSKKQIFLNEAVVGEKRLIPLRGDFTPEQSKQQEHPVNA